MLRISPQLKTRNWQLGSREKHGVIEKINCITTEIRTAFEHYEYFSSI